MNETIQISKLNEAGSQRIILLPDLGELFDVILLDGGFEHFGRAQEGFDDNRNEQVDKHVAADDTEQHKVDVTRDWTATSEWYPTIFLNLFVSFVLAALKGGGVATGQIEHDHVPVIPCHSSYQRKKCSEERLEVCVHAEYGLWSSDLCHSKQLAAYHSESEQGEEQKETEGAQRLPGAK